MEFNKDLALLKAVREEVATAFAMDPVTGARTLDVPKSSDAAIIAVSLDRSLVPRCKYDYYASGQGVNDYWRGRHGQGFPNTHTFVSGTHW